MPGLRAFWFYEKTVVRHLVRQFRYKKTGSTAGGFLFCTAGFFVICAEDLLFCTAGFFVICAEDFLFCTAGFFVICIRLSFLCYLKLSHDTYPVTYFPTGVLPQEAAVVVTRYRPSLQGTPS